MEDDNIFIFLLCSGPKSFDKCYLAGWHDGGKLYFSVGQALCKPKRIRSSQGTFLFCPHPLPLQCPTATLHCDPPRPPITHVPFCPAPHRFSYYLPMTVALPLAGSSLPLPHASILGPPLPTQGQWENWDRAEVRMLRPGGPGHHPALATASVTSQLQRVTWVWVPERTRRVARCLSLRQPWKMPTVTTPARCAS